MDCNKPDSYRNPRTFTRIEMVFHYKPRNSNEKKGPKLGDEADKED